MLRFMMRLKSSGSSFGLWLGPVLFALIELFADFSSDSVTHMTAVTALMVTWWISEAIPLAATALLPIVLFPLLGIATGKDVAKVYMNSTIFLFIGGFVLALAMQRWNLHQRIAMRIISWFHGSASMMVMGFMLTSAFLSMWISNTATATMLLPIGLAVYARCSDILNEDEKQRLLTALMLGIAYACSIGGAGTLIGTPPNMAMQRIYSITFPDAVEISFAQWLFFAFPLAVMMLGLCWLVITRRYIHRDFTSLEQTRTAGGNKTAMTYEEKAVATIFILTALCWIFRKDIDIGLFIIPGWSQLFEYASYIDDGTVAITAALLLFILPSRNRQKYRSLVDVDTIAEIPWKIVLLFGGGFALAKGFTTSGLAELVGQQFIGLKELDTLAIISGTSAIVVFLTEFTSNTATAEMLLPLAASVAQAISVDPLLLMIPVTLSASMAFMMPVATPPNAIVFASGKLRIRDMVTTGFIMNMIAIFCISIAAYYWGKVIFSY